MVTTKLMTGEDLLALPDDGYQYELIEGELIRVAAAGMNASRIAVAVGGELRSFVRPRGLGVVTGADGGFYLARDPDTVIVPDVAFTRADRLLPEEWPDGFSPVLPDLVVEIVSPTDRPRQVQTKVDRYLAAGVPLAWVVRPRPQTVTVHPLGADPVVLTVEDELDGGDVLPGFRIAVAELFR